MTDFLDRWSRRKAAGAAPALPPEIPIEDLPDLARIDAFTDLSPWLRLRVPEAWRAAALRRMWVADPAISGFVGLADYAWDWNTPGGAPGFGAMRAADDIAQLLAQAIDGTDAAKVVPDEAPHMAALPPDPVRLAPPPEPAPAPDPPEPPPPAPARRRHGGATPV